MRLISLIVLSGAAVLMAGCAGPTDAALSSAQGVDNPQPAAQEMAAEPSTSASAPAASSAASPMASTTPSTSATASPSATGTPRLAADPALTPRSAAVALNRVDTAEKVVFLTIDDGGVADPKLLAYLAEQKIPVTMFLTTNVASANWTYWRDMGVVGSVQNHTIGHPYLNKASQAGAAKEICGANALLAQNTGQTPWMLRPPYGEYNSTTRAAAGDCGIDYVVHWSVSLPSDKLIYQSGSSLRPGDIILTHFRWDLMDYLPTVMADIQAQGYRVARLEDYLPPTTPAKS